MRCRKLTPPSTYTICPVMNAEASEARKIAAADQVVGDAEPPQRRIGHRPVLHDGLRPQLVGQVGEDEPGGDRIHPDPARPHSAARDRVICCSPDLLTA